MHISVNILLFIALLIFGTSIKAQWNISGDISGVISAGITVNLFQNGNLVTTATTDSNGNYTLTNVSDGKYTVMPNSRGFVFTPEAIGLTIQSSSVSNQKFKLDCPDSQIFGSTNVGFGGSVKYYTNDYVKANYFWSIEGGKILSGQGTRSVNVVWTQGVTQGTIRVSGSNICGNFQATKEVSISSYVRELPMDINGEISDMKYKANILYIAGSFSYIGPKSGYGVPIDALTGKPMDNFPFVDGKVLASIPDGAGGFYIGGEFVTVGGVSRNSIARINADGTVHSWNPNIPGLVSVLAMGNGVVYAAGAFARVGTANRIGVAAVDINSGIATDWNANIDRQISSIGVGKDAIYVSGHFTSIGGKSRNQNAALDINSGILLDWDPNLGDRLNYHPDGSGGFYVWGFFKKIGNVNRNGIARIYADGSLHPWNPNISGGSVHCLTVGKGVVYVGGTFKRVGNESRNSIAAIDSETGTVTKWNPSITGNGAEVWSLFLGDGNLYVGGGFNTVGKLVRGYTAAIDTATGIATDWNPNPNAGIRNISYSSGQVYLSGDFTSVGGTYRYSLAAIDLNNNTLLRWNPHVSGTILSCVMGENEIYIGGNFSYVNGQSRGRNNIAAIDLRTGNATNFDPNANSWVHQMVLNNNILYVAGCFSKIGGENRNNLAAINVTTGEVTSWNPDQSDNCVRNIVISNNIMYAVGWFQRFGTHIRNCIAAIDIHTAEVTSWDPKILQVPTASDPVFIGAIYVYDNTIYTGGWFDDIGGKARNNFAALDTLGYATNWNPKTNGHPHCMYINKDVVYVGGRFGTMGGQTRSNLAALSRATGEITNWNPTVNNDINCMIKANNFICIGGNFSTVDKLPTRNLALIIADDNDTVSILEPKDKISSVRIMPTLTDGVVHVYSSNSIQGALCEVHSYIGGKVAEYRLDGEGYNAINLHHLLNGVYGIRIILGGDIVGSSVIQLQK